MIQQVNMKAIQIEENKKPTPAKTDTGYFSALMNKTAGKLMGKGAKGSSELSFDLSTRSAAGDSTAGDKDINIQAALSGFIPVMFSDPGIPIVHAENTAINPLPPENIIQNSLSLTSQNPKTAVLPSGLGEQLKNAEDKAGSPGIIPKQTDLDGTKNVLDLPNKENQPVQSKPVRIAQENESINSWFKGAETATSQVDNQTAAGQKDTVLASKAVNYNNNIVNSNINAEPSFVMPQFTHSFQFRTQLTAYSLQANKPLQSISVQSDKLLETEIPIQSNVLKTEKVLQAKNSVQPTAILMQTPMEGMNPSQEALLHGVTMNADAKQTIQENQRFSMSAADNTLGDIKNQPETAGVADKAALISKASDLPVQDIKTNLQPLPANTSQHTETENKAVNVFTKTADTVDMQQKDEKTGGSHLLPTALSLNSRTVVPISDASTQVQKPVFNQVTDQILLNYNQNKKEFEMELYPENLGKVSVKLSMENSVLTVVISAENPKTQSMLLSHAGNIQSILQDTVSQPVHVVDPQQSQWYQQYQGNQHPSQQQQQQQQEQNQALQYALSDSENGEDFLSLMQRLRIQTVNA